MIYTTSLVNSQVENPLFHNGTKDIKSQNNAFSWRVEPEPIGPLTAQEKERAYQREYAKTKYVKVADRVKEITDFKGPVHNYGSLSGTSEAKAKTARLVGKSNSARSQ